jgi:hypothetical protein
MIIEQPLKANDTVTIKTTGGDEIVARFVQEDTNTITVSKPLALMATPNGIGLGPFAFTVAPDAKLKINKNTVIFIAKTEESMAGQYMTSTSSIKPAASIPSFKL